jgi:hypothetical protein
MTGFLGNRASAFPHASHSFPIHSPAPSVQAQSGWRPGSCAPRSALPAESARLSTPATWAGLPAFPPVGLLMHHGPSYCLHLGLCEIAVSLPESAIGSHAECLSHDAVSDFGLERRDLVCPLVEGRMWLVVHSRESVSAICSAFGPIIRHLCRLKR